jgi:hypothetical protein
VVSKQLCRLFNISLVAGVAAASAAAAGMHKQGAVADLVSITGSWAVSCPDTSHIRLCCIPLQLPSYSDVCAARCAVTAAAAAAAAGPLTSSKASIHPQLPHHQLNRLERSHQLIRCFR